MKRIISLLLFFGLCSSLTAQLENVEKQLRERYKTDNVTFDRDSRLFLIKRTTMIRDSDKDILIDSAGVCDINGKELFAPGKYSRIDPKMENNKLLGYGVCVGNYPKTVYRGFCDVNFREIVRPQYTFVHPDIKDGVIVGFTIETGEVTNTKSGYCDANGRVLIVPGKYDHVYRDMDECFKGFRVSMGQIGSDKSGLCDINGREIIPCVYSQILPYCDYDTKEFLGFRVFKGGWGSGKLEGFLDTQGKMILPVEYKNLFIFNKEIYVQKGELYGVYNLQGQQIIPIEYSHNLLGFNHEGKRYYLACLKGDKEPSTILDAGGKRVCHSDYIEIPEEGLCRARKGDKWGFISIETGKVVVPFKYDKVEYFKDGVAKVTKNGDVSLLPHPLKHNIVTTNQPKVKSKVTSTYPAADSEVDKNIPEKKKKNPNTHAFIIANENYPAAKVPYALNDGWTFEQYCKKTLGIKEENVHLFEDATGGNIASCVEQIKQVAKNAKGNATIIFYYAGHAFPDEEKSTAYLLPIDGNSKDPATGYSLEKLYSELKTVEAEQILCFIDACFSGSTREDGMLISGRGVAIKVKDEVPQGNMVVMTSATGAETAHQYEEMHHGLFTYYLLEKLQQTKGDVTMGDLAGYVTKMVKRKSVTVNRKMQTPTVIPSPALQGSWQNIKL